MCVHAHVFDVLETGRGMVDVHRMYREQSLVCFSCSVLQCVAVCCSVLQYAGSCAWKEQTKEGGEKGKKEILNIKKSRM